MQRVIIVYNPRSSKAAQVREEVIIPAQKVAGVMVGKYGVLNTSVEDNAQKLSMILQDGDVVIAAGGDGTASIALNGVILSKKDVAFNALPYGNFNDMARALSGEEGKKWYPLEVKINGKSWRYVGCYFSVGMFASSTRIFDEKDRRAKLKLKRGSLVYSILQLALWYFQHKKETFLPDMRLNHKKMPEKSSDYLAVNSSSIARVMRSNKYGLQDKGFLSSTGRLTSFWRLMGFMMRSMCGNMPGKQVESDKIEFDGEETIVAQVEGEGVELKGVHTIEILKRREGVRISKKLW